jgi:hypothetical protein
VTGLWTEQFLGGHGIGGPPTIPEWVTAAFDLCTAVYDAGHDKVVGCDEEPGGPTGDKALAFEVTVPTTTFTRITCSLNTITTRTDVGQPDTIHQILIDGVQYASHGISSSFTGADDFILDTGSINVSGTVIRIESDIRGAYPAFDAVNELIAIQVWGLATDPFLP